MVGLYKSVAWQEVENRQESNLKQMVFIPSANMNIVKHYEFHNEATQGSRYKYNGISPTGSRGVAASG